DPGPTGPLSAKNDPLDHFSGAPIPLDSILANRLKYTLKQFPPGDWIGLDLYRAPEIRRNTKDPSFEQAQAGTFAYAAMVLKHH
ncbi:MAG: hypothetical protein IJU12_05610, partial [Clostridia bacterium]|nr:hypothetical protein [Clostridia bacterium]